jgi:hypothetical protein
MKQREISRRWLIGMTLALMAASLPASAQTNAGQKSAATAQKGAKGSAAAPPRVFDCAAIEVGFTGVKGGLYTFTESAEGIDVKMHGNPKENPIAGFKDGAFTADGIKDMANAINDILADLKKKAADLHLQPKYYVVASSSVAEATNIEAMREAAKAKTGIDVDTVKASEESQLAWISSVPRNRYGQVLLFDIGGGNTKIGYLLTAINKYSAVEVKWGSRSLAEAVPADCDIDKPGKDGKDFQAAIQEVIDSKVMPTYKAAVEKNGALAGLNRIYLIGGSAWAVGVVMHPEQALERRWVRLSPGDFDAFLARVKNGTWNRDPAHNPVMAGKSRELVAQATTDLDELKSNNAMTPKRMIAGASLIKAYLSRSSKELTIFFPRHGQWLYGYVLTKFVEGESNTAHGPAVH